MAVTRRALRRRLVDVQAADTLARYQVRMQFLINYLKHMHDDRAAEMAKFKDRLNDRYAVLLLFPDAYADPCLVDGDWQETFKYANKPDECPPGWKMPTHGFSALDVSKVIAKREGENDGDDWLMVGKLYDRRFFFIKAGCDYTGWG